jgi:hypothetical protein
MRLNKPAIQPLNAAAVLKRHGLRADKSLGQNFCRMNPRSQKLPPPPKF